MLPLTLLGPFRDHAGLEPDFPSRTPRNRTWHPGLPKASCNRYTCVRCCRSFPTVFAFPRLSKEESQTRVTITVTCDYEPLADADPSGMRCLPLVCEFPRNSERVPNRMCCAPLAGSALLWSLRGLNPPPSPCHGDALPNELRPQVACFRLHGLG